MKRLCVIGGGPAGLTAAITAVQAGMAVTLLNDGLIGDNIRCAEGFIDSLRLFGEPEAGARFQVEEVLVQVKQPYLVDGSKVDIWMIDRQEWQQHLARKGQSLGIRIRENYAVGKDELPQLLKEYDWVIDASGVPSVSSRAYNFKKWYVENGAITAQYVLAGDFSALKNKIKLGLEPHYHGYYWVFPKGKDINQRETANVGIGWFSNNKTKAAGLNIWQALEQVLIKEGLQQYRRVRRFGGICPLKMPPRIVFDNLLLAGDASGLTSPLHGGGIDLAIISGQIAVEAITKGCPEDYPEMLMQVIGPKLEVEWRLFRLWESFTFDQVDDLFRLIIKDYGSVSMKNLLTYPAMLIKELNTIARLWNGLSKGQWDKGII